MLIISILATIFGVAGGIAQSVQNRDAQHEANETNLEIARETNAANAEQAELAYKRSLPITQLNDMMSAGMSKPAALQKLAGGGSYTAPTMQSAQVGPENLDLSAIAERIGNIPSNVAQSQMVTQQLDDMKAIARQRDEELRMKQEQHRLEMLERYQRMDNEQREELRKQYGQDVLESVDKLRSRVVEAAREKNIPLSSLQSEDDIARLLADDDSWKNAPALARDNIITYVRSNALDSRQRAAESRAAEMHNKDVRAKDDAHRLSIQTEKRVKQEVREYLSSSDTRERQQHVENISAKLAETIAEQESLRSEYERGDLFYKDEDGYWHLTDRGRSSSAMKQFFNWLGTDRSLSAQVIERAIELVSVKK